MNPPFENIGKVLVIGGGFLIVLGLLFIFFNKIPFLGKFPGDILIKKENFTFYFPLVTSIVLSLLISLVIFLIKKFQ